MRIRSTKPEFWRSERVASVDWDARLVLKGLESYVDDNGVGKDDLALICADVFPRDLTREPSRTLARVSTALNTLREAGLLWRYEHNGTPLLFIAFWESIQRIDRASNGRFPRPDGTWDYKESEIRECVASPREDDASPRPRNRGTGEQGNRGTEAAQRGPKDDNFDAFWSAFPRRIAKEAARKAWAKAVKTTDPSVLIEAAATYATTTKGTDPKFIKHPATWLNGGCWEDETFTPRPSVPIEEDWGA